jgi:hypothetical protein
MRMLVASLLLLVPATARAQAEFYNLDDDRPSIVEDAYPNGRGGLELQLGLARIERTANEDTSVLSQLEVSYGAYYNLHIGAAARAIVGAVNDGPVRTGLSDTSVFALYNFNREGELLPAFAIRADVGFPTGRFSAESVRATVKGIVTRSFGRLRAHLNATHGFGEGAKQSFASDLTIKHLVGLALDYPLTYNFVLIVEAAGAQHQRSDELELDALLGARWQVSPRVVLDFGAGRGLLTGGDRLAATIGLTFTPGAFGL